MQIADFSTFVERSGRSTYSAVALKTALLYFALYENLSLLSPVEFSKTTVFITTAV